MTRRILIPALLTFAVLPLTGCFAPAPEPTPTEPPRPASMDGEWVIDRVVATSFAEAEAQGTTVGSSGPLYVLFTEGDCTELECVGTALSSATLGERETASSEGTYVNDDLVISYTYDRTYWSDCKLDDGTVIATDAYFHDISYSVSATEVVDGEILAFEGQAVRIYGMSDEAIAAECTPYVGEVVYDISGHKS